MSFVKNVLILNWRSLVHKEVTRLEWPTKRERSGLDARTI